MRIANILVEITAESGTNKKMEILGKYKDDELLKRVLYLGTSKRVKFYIKQIPTYTTSTSISLTLGEGLDELTKLSNRSLSGNNAINHLSAVLSTLTPTDASVIEKIIKKKLNIGMGRTNINKVIGKGFLEKTPYMGAKSYSLDLVKKLITKSNGNGVYSNVKMDGRYCNSIIRGGEVEMESRQGEPTILDGAKFLKELESIKDEDGNPVECVLNGELTIKGVPRYESNGVISSMIDITKKREERGLEKTQKKIDAFEKKHGSFEEMLDRIIYTVWDSITVDEYYDNKSDRPYGVRVQETEMLISMLTNVEFVEYKIVYTVDEAMEHFQELLNRGEEGTVLKALDGKWKDGKPTWQIKFKLEMEMDLVITGFNYGTGKNSEVISSLTCKTSEGILETRPTGIKEDMMAEITERQDELLGTIVVVKCSGVSQDIDGNYSLLHPVFKYLRDDKDVADSLEDVKAIENMAKGL